MYPINKNTKRILEDMDKEEQSMYSPKKESSNTGKSFPKLQKTLSPDKTKKLEELEKEKQEAMKKAAEHNKEFYENEDGGSLDDLANSFNKAAANAAEAKAREIAKQKRKIREE